MLDIVSKKLKPPYLIHSDLFKTFGLIKEEYKENNGKFSPFDLHFNLLAKLFSKENIILPSFNYEFPNTKFYHTKLTTSQVGSLGNYVLENQLLLRTKTPIFSFLTNIKDVLGEHNFPFSTGSIFDFINKNDGTIIFQSLYILFFLYVLRKYSNNLPLIIYFVFVTSSILFTLTSFNALRQGFSVLLILLSTLIV
jgi:hypothetical protein